MVEQRPGYAESHEVYARAGWPTVPMRGRSKDLAVTGATGQDGVDADRGTAAAWAARHPDSNLAVRLPEGVIGIDVDAYTKDGTLKHGPATLAAAVARWGPLPPTWSSTARGLEDQGMWRVGESRVMFFRLSRPRRLAGQLPGGDVEVLQRHHRYALVAPSLNPEAEYSAYRWYGPDGVSAAMPRVDELPLLPPAWEEGLAAGASAARERASAGAGAELLRALFADDRPPCVEVDAARASARGLLGGADVGSRHDAMLGQVFRLVALGADGHPGVGEGLRELGQLWTTLVGPGRDEELVRAGEGAAAKARAATPVRPAEDPCAVFAGGVIEAPGPTADAPPFSWRQHVALPWSPRGHTDTALADSALRTLAPVIRFAPDTGRWLMRGPDRWHAHDDHGRSLVAALAVTLPRGQADGDDEAKAAAKRWARMQSAAGMGAVATVLRARITDPDCPLRVEATTLDTDAEVLWAGGVPWDLRASGEIPVPALHIHPGTPHLQSAAALPDHRVPTPIWDALTSTVWPDPEVRAWALRVLSIGVTGHPDRALPVLVGPPDRGKSQVVVRLAEVLGTYALGAADAKLVSAAGDSAHGSITYALMGKRLAFVDEPPGNGKAARERLKALTGGAPLTGNAMRSDPVVFNPTHTLVMAANPDEMPDIDDGAVRSRVRLIPCEGDVDAVRTVIGALHRHRGAWRAEWPGVLAAMMAHASAWLDDHASATTAAAPEHIRVAEALEVAEQDTVAQWLTARTTPDEAGSAFTELYGDYHDWCRDVLRQPLSRIPTGRRFGAKLAAHGYPALRTNAARIRQLRLLTGTGFPSFTPRTHASPDASRTGDASAANFDASPSAGGEVGRNGQVPDGYVNSVTMTDPTSPDGDASEASPTPDASPDASPGVSPGQEPVFTSLVTDDGSTHKISKRSDQTHKYTENGGTGTDTVTRHRVGGGEHIGLPALTVRDGATLTVRPLTGVPDWGTTVRALLGTLPAIDVDIEHTGYAIGAIEHRVRSVQLGGPDYAVDLDPHDPEQLTVALDVLAAAPRLHAHSAPADLAPLAHHVDGLALDTVRPRLDGGALHESWWTKMWDTGLPAKLLDPAGTPSGADLKSLSERHVPDAVSPGAEEARDEHFAANGWTADVKPGKTPPEKSGWAQVDPGCEVMVRYATADTIDGARLAALYDHPKLTADVIDRERAIQRIVSRVSHTGIALDVPYATEQQAVNTRARRGLATTARERWGIENVGSPKQVGEALLALGAVLPPTPQGKPSTAAAVLEPLRSTAEGELLEAAITVLDWRHHDTALKLLLGPWLAMASGDGRLYPTVHTLGADTGRMSCVRPNLQQVSREGGLRECLLADEGMAVISADFAGVELRVAAALSGDAQLRQLILDGVDVHALIAMAVWGQEEGKHKRRRYQAKRIVFGRLYGGAIDTLAAQAGLADRHDLVTRALDAMDEITPGVVRWAEQVKGLIRGGQTEYRTYSGRIIHLDKRFPHKGPNYLIQGTARELLGDTLLRWDEGPWGGGVVLPVHDEVVAMVPKADGPAALEHLKLCMTTELGGVPIVAAAEAPPADRWHSAA